MVFRGGGRPRRRGWTVGLLLLGLLFLLEQLHFGGPVVRADTATRAWVLGHPLPVIHSLAELIADLANPPSVLALMLVGVVALALWRRSWQPLALAGTAIVMLMVAVFSLKNLVGRPGPLGDGALAWPSGHTTTSVVVCGVLTQLLCAEHRRVRTAIMVVVPGLVGVALVLRNYHWASDVVAGWLVGTLLLMAAVALVRWAFGAVRRRAEPNTAEGPQLPAFRRVPN